MARARQQTRARRYIERLLTHGHIDAGGRLPSTRSLAVALGCARTTVNAAVDELIAEGYVIARARSGLYANPQLQRITSERHERSTRTASWTRRLAAAPSVRTTPPASRWWEWRYPLITGQIEPALLARRGWERALRTASSNDRVWSYAEHAGDDPLLVEQICSVIAASRGIFAEPENVLITLGSQHGLTLLAQALVRPGESVVAMEEPGYPDAREVLAASGAQLRGVPVDETGLQVDRLPDDADIAYVTPSHQHPTNATLSLPRRADLLGAARRRGIVVIEDDYDSELRYTGSASPALYSLDHGATTVYLGTFSKFHSPGLRIGYVIADAAVIAALRPRLQLSIRQVPGVLQRALGTFIDNGDYSRALASYRTELAARWELAAELIEAHIGVRDTYPPGGTSLWVPAPAGIDWAHVVRPAADRGILLSDPTAHWLATPARHDRLRLGFTAASRAQLGGGIEELGKVCATLAT